MENRQYTIGLANLSETIPFAVTVRQSIEAAVALDPNLKLVVRDNDMNTDTALANVEEFAALPVDLAIIYHIDENAGAKFNQLLNSKKIPIIAIDIPIPWAVFFGINNKKAGFLAGEALGKWAQRNWNGEIDKILAVTEQRVSNIVAARISSAIDGIFAHAKCSRDDVLYIDGAAARIPSSVVAKPVLERWSDSHRIAVVGFNDDTALGVIDAAREIGREADIAVIGQGANLAVDEFKNPGTRFIASTAYYPERYGEQLIDLAWRMLRRERVPRENLIDPICLTVDDYSAKTAS